MDALFFSLKLFFTVFIGKFTRLNILNTRASCFPFASHRTGLLISPPPPANLLSETISFLNEIKKKKTTQQQAIGSQN